MAKPRITNNFLNYTILNSSSNLAQFPPQAIADLAHPQRSAHTLTTTNEWWVLDLGAAYSNLTVFFDQVNFTSVRIQMSNNVSETWTTPPFDSGLLTIAQDKSQGVYRSFFDLLHPAYRYLRIFIPTQTPVLLPGDTSPASYFQLGAFGIPINFFDLSTNFAYPFSYVHPIDKGDMLQIQLPSGTVEMVRYGRYPAINVTMHLILAISGNIGDAQNIWEQFRDATSLLWIDFGLGNQWQGYLCRRIDALNSSNTDFGTVDLGSITLQVVV